ncbi:uncharacterized protein EI97DRAFT_29657 [Westerdykella ornata]|uniref:Extracellular membrane protein CFEM domain-containing protein n=1 Tax=Westerdykella ornata TaxID=318751 RepID=A0A6A6JYZ4_WESOR|nr:uncharacterized protein EI97DRAFT_29657 [Westerdykella ornata]KAF2281454.1 hypothetical protein EI97DRAFT_29657 [Westerdykella ornata]
MAHLQPRQVFTQLDGSYYPFKGYPNYDQMAPCMKDCEQGLGSWNGCDKSPCWCKKGNLDLRMSQVGRCASEACTFANMNTQTDMDYLSSVQVQYCIDKGHSPEGMTLPSTAEASPTDSSQTGPMTQTGTRTGSSTSETGARTRNTLTSGPQSTGPSSADGVPVSTGGLSTGAKAGIGIGLAFCVLLAILIGVLVFRRRKSPQQLPPPPPPPQYYPPNGAPGHPPMNMPPPGMGPGHSATPYSGTGPYAPPPLQQPTPIHPPKQGAAYQAGDVSPIEEKAALAAPVTRKEVGKTPGVSAPSSPSPVSAVPAAAVSNASDATDGSANRGVEVPGSVPPPRHEVPTDGEITNSVSARGQELDGAVVSGQQYTGAYPFQQQEYPGQQQYPGQAQGQGQGQWAYNYPTQQQQQQQQQMPAHEVDGNVVPQGGQRQELSGNGWGYAGGPPPMTYELGPGR